MLLQPAVESVIHQLTDTLDQINTDSYASPCCSLSGNSIGKHVRHIIELFQCLEAGYATGCINYDERKRNADLENDPHLAIVALKHIATRIDRENKSLMLEMIYDKARTGTLIIETNYFREVAYNLEHTIHHMALIRIGLNEKSFVGIPADFGVASSTLRYQKQCVQ